MTLLQECVLAQEIRLGSQDRSVCGRVGSVDETNRACLGSCPEKKIIIKKKRNFLAAFLQVTIKID